MSDLSDKRVREIADPARGWAATRGPTDFEVTALAREVLALRTKLTEAVAVALANLACQGRDQCDGCARTRARLDALQEER